MNNHIHSCARKRVMPILLFALLLGVQATQLMAGTLVFFHGGETIPRGEGGSETKLKRGLYNFDTSTGISTFELQSVELNVLTR